MTLTADLAQKFATIALGHVEREYPNKMDHVFDSDADIAGPRALHPVFFGSFDWHSCVHSHWMLLTLLRRFPDIAAAPAIAALADRAYMPEKIAAECAYLDRPSARGFERPYGWAWALMLHAEASRHPDRGWAEMLEPFARRFADRFRRHLPLLSYPIRTGSHANTAFAMTLALDWAEMFDPALAALIGTRATDHYGEDRDCAGWEPSGDDFLSPALVEAQCMQRVLGGKAFRDWFGRFLPRLTERQPETLFTPAVPSDRSDGKIAHLDGLNLSRAWCWRNLATAMDTAIAEEAADAHLAASLPHVAGDYMGEHWLASFAVLALE